MGALTLKVFSNESRDWELVEGEGIDPTDSFGTNLKIFARSNQIFLVEPNDPDVPWITDRGRLFFEGMFDRSIDEESISWGESYNKLSEIFYFSDHLNLHVKRPYSFIFAFETVSIEITALLQVLNSINSNVLLKKVDTPDFNSDFEYKYLLNESTEKNLKLSNFGLLLNTNTRHECYTLNLNLRQRFLKGGFKLLLVGSLLDLTIPLKFLGSNSKLFKDIGEGVHLSCREFKNAEFPVIVGNTELFKRKDLKNFFKIMKRANVLTRSWNGFNVIQPNIGMTGIHFFNNFLTFTESDFTNFFGLFFINVSLPSSSIYKKLIELKLLNLRSFKKECGTTFVDLRSTIYSENKLEYMKAKSKIYGDYLYLPSKLIYEDSSTFINTRGLIKRIPRFIEYKKSSKSEWQIIRKLSSNLKKMIFLNNKKDNNIISSDLSKPMNFKNFISFQFKAAQTLTSLSFYLNKNPSSITTFYNENFKNIKIKLLNTKLKFSLDDFFTVDGKDALSHNSSTLLNCSRISRSSTTNFF